MTIASPPAPWAEAGFDVEGDSTRVGNVAIRFAGDEGGIRGWCLSGARSAELDGLPTEFADRAFAADEATEATKAHPNGALHVDHLVVFTPQLKRTTAALEGTGVVLRRIREPDEPGPPVRQAFFRLGETILEVVENPRAAGPARFWGITIAVADIDRCAELLGEKLGEVHDAVQPGRRIATVRREARLGVPVALITT